MFRQWMKYGDTEVVNNQRVLAYVANGMTPVGAVIGNCAECDDLAPALGMTEGYRTPALDDPPWTTPEDADSNDFAGVYCVDMTGADGSTMTVAINERIGDGGLAGARRAASRTIAVTADLVGITPEATSAGMEWLTSVLYPPCSAATECAGDVLEMFTTCPDVCEGQPDLDADPITTVYDEAGWFTANRTPASPEALVNYVLNPVFELGDGSGVDDWFSDDQGATMQPATSIARVAPGAPFTAPVLGNYVAKVTWPAITTRSAFVQTFTGLTPGVSYTFHGWVFNPAITRGGISGYSNTAVNDDGPYETVKDKWVFLRHQFYAEATTHDVGFVANDVVDEGESTYFSACALIEQGSEQLHQFSAGPLEIENWVAADASDDSFTGPVIIIATSP